MKVVLFNPRAQKAHRRLPLSILMLARVLDDYVIVDGNVEPDAEARLESACATADVLLVTVMPGPQLRVAVPLCRRLRARFPRLKIVWGGYFPTVHTAAAAREVDAVVIGQGERSLPELLAAFEAGTDPAAVPGVAVWDGALRKGPGRAAARSADFGMVPYARVDMARYAAKTFLGTRTYNHHTSVGCPYFCNFCAVVNMYEGRWIPDPAADVVAHVRALATEHGANAVEFHDNNFFAWEQRCADVAAGITGLGVRWWGEGRIDTMLGFAGGTWEGMAKSGLAMVFFGAESGDDDTLAAMDKGGLRVADILALNRLAMRHGVVPEFSFVLGNAVDPARDTHRSLELVRALKRENPGCEIILYLYTPVPLPGQWDEARKRGFAFPETVDAWLAPPWTTFDGRRSASTPWVDAGLVRRIYDFEAVLNARYPSVSDHNLRQWQRTVLRALATPRWATATWRAPYGIRLLQKAWGYRRPEEMGF